jgi:hypothetical protein
MFKPHQSQLKTSRVNIRTQLRSQHLKFREVGKGKKKKRERKKMKKNQEISNWCNIDEDEGQSRHDPSPRLRRSVGFLERIYRHYMSS